VAGASSRAGYISSDSGLPDYFDKTFKQRDNPLDRDKRGRGGTVRPGSNATGRAGSGDGDRFHEGDRIDDQARRRSSEPPPRRTTRREPPLAEQTVRNMPRSDAHAFELLERFADAWNRHDLDALMSMMTDDCVFEASAGPDVDGQRSSGKPAVRAAFAAVFEAFPDAHWGNARHFVAGARGVSEWTFTGTHADGTRVAVTGCDLFTFRDGAIAIKNSYRKNRSARHFGPPQVPS
jgi:steroid delta-isomerase-like uncharacterized protein